MSAKFAFLIVLASFLSFPALTEGAPEDLSGNPSELTVAGLRGPTSVGMLGMFKDPPVLSGATRTEFIAVATPDLMIARLTSGEVDLAAVPVNLSAILYNKGLPYILAAITGDGVLYVLSSRTDILEVADLEGKIVYNVSKRQTPDYVFRYILSENGVDPDDGIDIRFDFSHLELAPQLVAGRMETAVLPEPFASTVVAKNPSIRVVLDLQEEWGKITGTGRAYPTSAFIVRRDLAARHPELIRELLDEYEASIAWVNGNHSEAGLYAKEYLGMDAEVTAAAMPNLNLRFSDAAAARGEVEGLFSVLLGFDPDSVGGALPGDDFYFER